MSYLIIYNFDLCTPVSKKNFNNKDISYIQNLVIIKNT